MYYYTVTMPAKAFDESALKRSLIYLAEIFKDLLNENPLFSRDGYSVRISKAIDDVQMHSRIQHLLEKKFPLMTMRINDHCI